MKIIIKEVKLLLNIYIIILLNKTGHDIVIEGKIN